MICKSLLFGLFCLLGAAVAGAQGLVEDFQKLSNAEGRLIRILDEKDEFGTSVAHLGDLDGDGVSDLAVGTPLDDDREDDSGAVWILFLNQDGTVKSHQKISNTDGGFTGELGREDNFGVAVINLGDFDGDGVVEIAVGAFLDDEARGAVWILFLNRDGTVKRHQKISATDGGFLGSLDKDDRFGASLTNLGDLDGDGVVDLAVGASRDDDGDSDRGAVWMLFLNRDGTVKRHQKISDIEGNFDGTLDNTDHFGTSVAGLDDLDKDGVVDLAVGAVGDDDGGEDRGAIWMLFLNQDGTVKAHQKISTTEGAFTGSIDTGGVFGVSVSRLDDLDGDGVVEIAVGAFLDDEAHGAVWMLFLNQDGTVKTHQEISDDEGGFTGTLDTDDRFGTSITWLGDLDGDGVAEVAAGAVRDDDAGNDRGAVWILFSNRDGTVKRHQKISATEGSLFRSIPEDGDRFGTAIARLADLDGDAVDEIAIGAAIDGESNTGAVWILFPNSDGTVKRHQKISTTEGAFTGVLDRSDLFGAAVTNLGDLDGDGVDDLAVGAFLDDDGQDNSGAVWILFLNRDGTVKGHQKISTTEGAFTGGLDDGDRFGNAVAALGDLDGDAIADLAVGAFRDDDNDGSLASQPDRGAVWILFLNDDGTVKSHQKISETQGGFSGALTDEVLFGASVANLGDLDRDGVPDLAVGAFLDDDGGTDRGAVWILSLNRNGTVKSHQKISTLDGGFAGKLDNADNFGAALTSLGDIDTDAETVATLAVGAVGDDDGVEVGGGDDRGAVWLLFLKPDGTVKGHQKISSTEGNFGGKLDDKDTFGNAVANLDDLNGDGVTDLAVGASFDDDGGTDRGAVWTLFLSDNQAPFVREVISDTALVLLVSNYRKNLNEIFSDPDNDPLTFQAETSDPSTAVAFLLADSLLVVDLTTAEVDSTARISVTAQDVLGSTASTSFIVTADTLPDIGTVVVNPREPKVGEALTLQAKITDNSGFIKALLLYKRGGEDAFSYSEMTLADSSIYTVTVPSDFMTDRGLEYSIVAVDNRCFPAFTPRGMPTAFVPIASEGITSPAPQPSNAYRLVSAPLDLQAKSPAAVLEDDLGNYDNTRWRFFEVNHQLDDDAFTFKEFHDLIDEDRNMLPGKAFLLIIEEDGKTFDTGPGVSISTIYDFPIDLFPGWNFIGNPFNYTIPVGNLRLQSSGGEPALKTFENGWIDVDEIRPFQGYAVLNGSNEPDILFIDPGLTVIERADLAILAEAIGCDPEFLTVPQKRELVRREPEAWSIRILAQSRQARDVDTRVAVAASASAAWDPLDRPEPPGFGDHVSVYFSHPEWQRNTARYSADVRPEPTDGAVWPLTVTSTLRDDVHLTFEGLDDVPAAYDVWLVDELLDIVRNLRETNTYTVAGAAGPRSLKLVVGKRGFLEDKGFGGEALPERFELFANFPNPFNPATTLRYGLPEAAHVSLVVYNILGERVAMLEGGAEKQAGYHAVVWDGRSDAGTPVASGVYFARMQAGRFAQTQKMILVK